MGNDELTKVEVVVLAVPEEHETANEVDQCFRTVDVLPCRFRQAAGAAAADTVTGSYSRIAEGLSPK